MKYVLYCASLIIMPSLIMGMELREVGREVLRSSSEAITIPAKKVLIRKLSDHTQKLMSEVCLVNDYELLPLPHQGRRNALSSTSNSSSYSPSEYRRDFP